MSLPSDSRPSRTAAATGTAARTRFTTGRTTTVIVVGGIRFWRRARIAAGDAWTWLTDTVGTAGWLVGGAAVAGLWAGLAFGWIEFAVAGIVAVVLLALSVPFLFGARAYHVDLFLGYDRVVAGSEVSGALSVRNVGAGPALPGTVDVPIGDGLVEIAVPLLRAGASFDEQVVVPTRRRGIVDVGPARTVRGDPLGILRRENTWKDVHTLYVHPVTTGIPSTSTGFIRDLEGGPSSLVVDADISFHALREYAPGDSPRQVHWKSTAKTGTLMVRQYEESRRSRMLIALATAEAEFADEEEFELAVSAVGSLGIRGIRDGRDVSVVVGREAPELARRPRRSVRELATVTTRTLLDDLSGLDRHARADPLVEVAGRAVEAHPDVSVGFLVCGSTETPRTIRSAALAFPPDVGVAAIVCDPQAEPGVRRLGEIAVVTVGLLDDLRQILSRSAAS